MQCKIFRNNDHEKLEQEINDWYDDKYKIYHDFDTIKTIEDLPNNTILVWYHGWWTHKEQEQMMEEIQEQGKLDYEEQEKQRKIREIEQEIEVLKHKPSSVDELHKIIRELRE